VTPDVTNQTDSVMRTTDRLTGRSQNPPLCSALPVGYETGRFRVRVGSADLFERGRQREELFFAGVERFEEHLPGGVAGHLERGHE
jgi:hypothetical protein